MEGWQANVGTMGAIHVEPSFLGQCCKESKRSRAIISISFRSVRSQEEKSEEKKGKKEESGGKQV